MFLNSALSPSRLRRFRYVSRLLTNEDTFLTAHGASPQIRSHLRQTHFAVFRQSLRLFEKEFSSVEAMALSKMTADGITFEKVLRTRIAIRTQLWKLRTAGWLYRVGAPNAGKLSLSAIAGLTRIVQPRFSLLSGV